MITNEDIARNLLLKTIVKHPSGAINIEANELWDLMINEIRNGSSEDLETERFTTAIEELTNGN
jgi:hypothetical protein